MVVAVVMPGTLRAAPIVSGKLKHRTYQVHTAPRANLAGGRKLKEHDVLTLGVLNDNGTLNLEGLLSHGLIGVTAYAL